MLKSILLLHLKKIIIIIIDQLILCIRLLTITKDINKKNNIYPYLCMSMMYDRLQFFPEWSSNKHLSVFPSLFTALEYHNLNTSVATRDYWVITGNYLNSSAANQHPDSYLPACVT